MKKCNKCSEEKLLNAFGIRSKEKDGLNPSCKECIKEQNKKYYFTSKKDYMKQHNQKQEVKEYNKQWIEENKDRFKENRKKWNEDNKEKIKEYSLVYSKKIYHNNIDYKISLNLRNRLNDALKNNIKTSSVIKLLGCSLKDFKLYLEQQFLPEMNWKNHGTMWEIDHIKPCASFELSDLTQQSSCFNYTNHQPLFKTTKIAKSLGYENYVGNRDKSKKF
jgi:ribosome-binding ATPase YchF (GTP1/OBG family)